MINSVTLIGRLGKDPEMKYFESGNIKTLFSIAVNEWTKDGDKTHWIPIECWGKTAERAGEFLRKGALVGIEGRLLTWESGEKKGFVVKADNFEMLDKKPD